MQIKTIYLTKTNILKQKMLLIFRLIPNQLIYNHLHLKFNSFFSNIFLSAIVNISSIFALSFLSTFTQLQITALRCSAARAEEGA